MNLLRRFFPASQPNTEPSPAQLESRALLQYMDAVGAQRLNQPDRVFKRRHLLALRSLKVNPTLARVRSANMRHPGTGLSGWWDPDEVQRTFTEEELSGATDANPVVLVETQPRLIRLLDGTEVTAVREIYFDISTRRHSKVLYALDDDGARIDYNAIPKHLMPLDGMDTGAPSRNEDVIVVEGYPAAEALRERGVQAFGIMSGTFDTPSERALAPLLQASNILLWPDNDSAGVALMAGVARRLAHMSQDRAQIKIVRWLGGPRKGDAFDFDGSDAELAKLLADATKWSRESQTAVNSVVRLDVPRGATHLKLSHSVIPPRPEIRQ